MAKCDSCGSIIVFGGKRIGSQRFCSDTCVAKGQLLAQAQRVPEEAVQREVWSVHLGLCPKCTGSGPVDVHSSYRIWSAVILTRWISAQQISCRACGRKSQLLAILYSAVLGWWGFPYGLIMTPVQIVRNLAAMGRAPTVGVPSPRLENLVRLRLAKRNAPEVPPVVRTN